MVAHLLSGLAVALLLPFSVPAGTAAPVDPRPASPAVDDAPLVGMVGNSISWQATDEIRHHVGARHDLVYFDAVIGATIASQRPSLVDAVRSPGGPDILLIELGTNDAGRNHTLAQFANDVRVTLDAVTPHVDHVLWFDMKNTGSAYYQDFNRNAPAFNATLRAVAADYPSVVVGHYSAWAAAAGDAAFALDLVHLSPWGEDELGRMAAQAANGFDPALTTGPYWDVRDDSWAATAIAWCSASGVVSGYPNGSYRAIAGTVAFTVDRAQWLNMLWQNAGAPTGHPPAPWPDTPAWIDGAARWASAEGVAVGYPDGTLRPYQGLARSEAVVMLYRLLGSPPVDELPPHGLSDVPPWLEGAVRLTASVDIVAGYPDGSFRPDVVVTRAQAANFNHRFSGAPPVSTAPPTTAPAPAEPPASAPTTSPTSVPPTAIPTTTGPTSSLAASPRRSRGARDGRPIKDRGRRPGPS